MKRFSSKRHLVVIMVMAFLLALAIPSTSFAQHGRWRGRSRDRWDWSRDRKCGRFVNCHDARDGRWDGRGPQGSRVGNFVWRNRARQRFQTRSFNRQWRQRNWRQR